MINISSNQLLTISKMRDALTRVVSSIKETPVRAANAFAAFQKTGVVAAMMISTENHPHHPQFDAHAAFAAHFGAARGLVA